MELGVPEDQQEREALQIEHWHYLYYDKLGFKSWQAEFLHLHGVSPHDAERLIRAGCSHRLAVRILT